MWRCKSDYCTAIASCNGYVDITSGSEESLLDALVNVGPIRYTLKQLFSRTPHIHLHTNMRIRTCIVLLLMHQATSFSSIRVVCTMIKAVVPIN